MRPKIVLPLIVILVLVWGTVQFLIDYSSETKTFNDYSAVVAGQMNRDLDNIVSMLSVLRMAPQTKLPSDIKGFATIALSGKLIAGSGDFSISTNYRTTNLYKFVSLNGVYISPLKMVNGDPVFTLATVSKDTKYIMAIRMTPPFLGKLQGFRNFFVDGTGLGVTVGNSNGPEWTNLSAVIAHNHKVPYVKNNSVIDVQKIDLGGYSFVFMRSLSSFLFPIVRGILISTSFILLIFLVIYYFTYFRFRKNYKPLIDFASFIGDSDSFKRYEPPYNDKHKVFKNYNSLVRLNDKFHSDSTKLSEDLMELNSELSRLNEFYTDFSMLLSEIKNNRSDFEDTLKIMMRRILDFSKTITGVGVRYGDMIINLGSVTIIDFDRTDIDKFSLNFKTEFGTARFIIGFDKFTVTAELKEIVKALLNQISSMMSMHELTEKNEISARFDPLTGLLTRQEFVALSERELARAKRMNSPISFIIFDIKNFTDFNEKYGTLNGDVLLKFIGKILMTSTRITDISCRYGEDEFILCLVDANRIDATKKLDSILSRIFAFKYKTSLKTSIISFPNDGETLEALLMKAEQSINMRKK